MFRAMRTNYPTTKYQPPLNELTNISNYEKEKIYGKNCVKFLHVFVKLNRKRQLCNKTNLHAL